MIRTWLVAAALAGALAAATVLGCRGGGANPSEQDIVIPFVEPTISERVCQNDGYPADAPQLDDVGDDADWTETASGLRQVVVEPGDADGDVPEADWRVTVKYTGWLESGCIFGTTYVGGQDEVRFFLRAVIAGWREAMLQMREGERRRLRIPSELGYGAGGRPPVIPGNATLIFDVTLLEAIPQAAADETATAVSLAAAATITAISEFVDETFTAEAEGTIAAATGTAESAAGDAGTSGGTPEAADGAASPTSGP